MIEENLKGKRSPLIIDNYFKRELCYVLLKVQRQHYETYEQFDFADREINDINS